MRKVNAENVEDVQVNESVEVKAFQLYSLSRIILHESEEQGELWFDVWE